MGMFRLYTGVVAIAISLYFLVGIMYPFASCCSDKALGVPTMLAAVLLFGAFGSSLCWDSVINMDDKRIGKKINRKRKKKFLSFSEPEAEPSPEG